DPCFNPRRHRHRRGGGLMKPTLRSVATEAATDLRNSVADRSVPGVQRRRPLTVLVATAIVVVVIAGVVALAGRGTSKTTSASELKVPAGYRAVEPQGGGFAVAIPAAWVDGPPLTDISKSSTLFNGHDPATGATVTIQAQDEGS